MLKKLLATFLVAACTGAAFQISLVAQQRGQQPANLTEKQWLESKEAQAHVTAAMAVTAPVADTVATVLSEDCHVACPVTSCVVPSDSFAVAVNCDVSPIAGTAPVTLTDATVVGAVVE